MNIKSLEAEALNCVLQSSYVKSTVSLCDTAQAETHTIRGEIPLLHGVERLLGILLKDVATLDIREELIPISENGDEGELIKDAWPIRFDDEQNHYPLNTARGTVNPEWMGAEFELEFRVIGKPLAGNYKLRLEPDGENLKWFLDCTLARGDGRVFVKTVPNRRLVSAN